MLNAWLSMLTKGRGLKDPRPMEAGHKRMKTVREVHGPDAAPFTREKYDGELTFDRLAGSSFNRPEDPQRRDQLLRHGQADHADDRRGRQGPGQEDGDDHERAVQPRDPGGAEQRA